MELSGLVLMMMLGLRHGFDPDHIAIIDGMSVRLSASHSRFAKWTGTLFAVGHGTIVTLITILISSVSHSFHFPPFIWQILDWMPGFILLTVALLNMKMLLTTKQYQPKGFKTFFLPRQLQNSAHPAAVVLIGALFAMVFDTNTQAAAWAYTATNTLNLFDAFLLGGSFTIGMIITDTIDSRILYSLIQQSNNNTAVYHYRKKIGWLIVLLSFSVGVYKISSLLFPAIIINETLQTLIGITFFLAIIIVYFFIVYPQTIKAKT